MNSAGQERVIGERQTRRRVREIRIPLPGGRQQIPDWLRPAAAPHHVRGQEARRSERGPDAVPPEPHELRQAGHDGARLRQRSRGDPEGIRAVLRNHRALGGDRPQPPLRGPGRLLAFGVFTTDDVETFARVYFGPKATQDQLYAALELSRQRFAELSPAEEATSVANSATTCVCTPSSPRSCHSRTPTLESSTSSPVSSGACCREPERNCRRDSAEHRHGVLPHPADEQRTDRPGAAGPAAQTRREQGPQCCHRAGTGSAFTDHRGVERALRPEPWERASPHAGATSFRPRPGPRPGRERPGEHPARTCG